MFEWITPEIWRRMLRAGLEKDIGLSGVVEAIEFWNAHFPDVNDRQKHIRPFTQAFTEFIGKPELRTAFALHIIAALHTQPEGLPTDPQFELDAAPLSKDPSSSTMSRLDACLRALVTALRQSNALQVLDTSARSFFDQSLATGGLPKTSGASQVQGVNVISAAYVALSALLGPVEADHVLSQAVRDVEDTPVGRAYSPRLFL